MGSIKILCIGDVIGNTGLVLFQKWASKLKEKYKADAIIVNGENSTKNGQGITSKIVEFFRHNGASAVTTGNHVWDNKEILSSLDKKEFVIRPANYPSGCPGIGYTFFNVGQHTVAVLNLHGRVFVNDFLDCPFRTIESLLTYIKPRTNIIIVDFHAEATSEKRALGFFLDGKVSAVFGTHTHVQTADEYILPNGTAYITDIGCCGALNSIIGMQFGGVLQKFLLNNKLGKFVVEDKGPMVISGICVDIDANSGKALSIERVKVIDDQISIK
jgi:metallophosphoesterase (TIGR00282 family)